MNTRFKVKIDNSNYTYKGHNKYMVLDTHRNLVAYNMLFEWVAHLLATEYIQSLAWRDTHEYNRADTKEMSLEELIILKGK